jgi:hypothetical protein
MCRLTARFWRAIGSAARSWFAGRRLKLGNCGRCAIESPSCETPVRVGQSAALPQGHVPDRTFSDLPQKYASLVILAVVGGQSHRLPPAHRERTHPPAQFVDFDDGGFSGLTGGQCAVPDLLKNPGAGDTGDLAGFVGADRNQRRLRLVLLRGPHIAPSHLAECIRVVWALPRDLSAGNGREWPRMAENQFPAVDEVFRHSATIGAIRVFRVLGLGPLPSPIQGRFSMYSSTTLMRSF